MNVQDNDRGTRNAPFGSLGVGKFLGNDNWSLDGELNYQNPNNDDNQDLNWSQYGISFDARRFFNAEGRNWSPYILMGVGYQRTEEEFDNFPNPNSPGERGGRQRRREARRGHPERPGRQARRDPHRTGIPGRLRRWRAGSRPELTRHESSFGDILASVGVVIPLLPRPAPLLPARPRQLRGPDDDGRRRQQLRRQVPGIPQAGQTIGPDGCPVPVSIDLKGVNFDFDKAVLRPDAISILSEAVQIFQRYPELRAEVAGHTDQCGSDAYNQKLSERRAKAVYDDSTTNASTPRV